MNKTELGDKLAERMNCSKAMAADMIAAFCDIVMEAVAADDAVQLIGFGTYSAKSRAERQGRNPSTGEGITISACKVPHFKAGVKFKEIVNQ